MQLESLSPEQIQAERIQAAMDLALRVALEVVMFAKIFHIRGEQPPDLGTELATALYEAIRTMNTAVELGYRPNDRIYGEVEKNMQNDRWRTAWYLEVCKARVGGRVGDDARRSTKGSPMRVLSTAVGKTARIDHSVGIYEQTDGKSRKWRRQESNDCKKNTGQRSVSTIG